MVIVEEALRDEEMGELREALDAQPAWSDIPLVLVASEGTELRGMVQRAFPNSGNITLLTRPLNPPDPAFGRQKSACARVTARCRCATSSIKGRRRCASATSSWPCSRTSCAIRSRPCATPSTCRRRLIDTTPADGNSLFAKTRDIIERQIVHLSRIVDDLLDVARLERGKVRLQLKRIDLNDAVTAAVESCLPITEAAGHSLRLDLCAQALSLDADAVRIEQLLANFITNAAKFTPRGGGGSRLKTRRTEPPRGSRGD